VEVSEVDRPCSVNVYVHGKQAGSFIIMQQPPNGVLHGSFTIDHVLDGTRPRGQSLNAVVSGIQSNMEAEIVRVSLPCCQHALLGFQGLTRLASLSLMVLKSPLGLCLAYTLSWKTSQSSIPWRTTDFPSLVPRGSVQ
jgi:hypothetical protein